MNEPKIGEIALDSISARRPSPIRFESTLVPTISPIAIISAVVSVMITKVTITMERMAENSNTGEPKWKKLGKAKIGPVLTLEKSVKPAI